LSVMKTLANNRCVPLATAKKQTGGWQHFLAGGVFTLEGIVE